MLYNEYVPEKNPFNLLVADLTHRCNMECANCYIPNRDVPDMDVEKLYAFLNKLPKRIIVRLIGAEPTMRKDLPEMIQRIRKTGNRCTLLTNGLRLAKDNYVKKLKQHGLRHCYLSMNGADNDDYYEQIDEMRCATKKVQALVNLKHNKFVIDTGTIIVKGVNDDVLERMLHLFKKVGVENVMARLKNVGDIGRSMQDQDNYTMEELIELASKQTGLSVDYINEWRHKPIYQNTEPEIDSFIFPMKPEQEGKLLHKSGIWFKIANWKGDEGQTIPLRNNKRRGRLTPEFKVAPFFEHVKMNEGGY